jgi:hypothetical protein
LDLTATGQSTNTGLSYYWQVSTNNGATWDTLKFYSTLQTEKTKAQAFQYQQSKYRQVTVCSNSGLSSFSNVLTVTMAPAYNCYCVPQVTGGKPGFNIVKLGSIVRNSTNIQPTAAPFYLAPIVGDTFKLYPGANRKLTVTIRPTDTAVARVNAYIDWNGDGYWDQSYAIGSNINPGSSQTNNILVPSYISTGFGRLRIIARETSSSFYANDCSLLSNGFVQDFYLVITTNTCSTAAVITGMITANSTLAICPGDNRTYTVLPSANATSYIWTPPVGGSIVSGQGTNSVTVHYDSGFVATDTVKVLATNDCGDSPLRRLVAKRGTPPSTPSILSGQLFSACNGSRSYSTSSVTGATSYQWSSTAGTAAANQTGLTYAVSYGTIARDTVRVAARNGCGASVKKQIVVQGTPNKPTISGPNCGSPNTTNTGYAATIIGADSIYWVGPTGSKVNLNGSIANTTNLLRTSTTANVSVTFGASMGSLKAQAKNACGLSSTATYAIALCGPRQALSASNTPKGITFELVPNPASEQVTVSLTTLGGHAATVRIMSISGQELGEYQMPSTLNGRLDLPISDLAPGVYLIEAVIEGQRMIKQLVKQ